VLRYPLAHGANARTVGLATDVVATSGGAATPCADQRPSFRVRNDLGQPGTSDALGREQVRTIDVMGSDQYLSGR